MFTRIRKRFTYSNVAMTLALVFAMSGGAFAASKYLITSTKQIKPSVLKQLQGKAGASGALGPAGPAGPQGAAGATGAKGEVGPKDEAGATGAKGEPGPPGKNGTTGFTSTLPKGKTEKGTWAFGLVPEGIPWVRLPISFSIPLEADLSDTDVHFILENGEEVVLKEGIAVKPLKEQTSTVCLGSAGRPEAAAGNLCVYGGALASANFEEFQHPNASGGPELHTQHGAGPTGVIIVMEITATSANGFGAWAVTAP